MAEPQRKAPSSPGTGVRWFTATSRAVSVAEVMNIGLPGMVPPVTVNPILRLWTCPASNLAALPVG